MPVLWPFDPEHEITERLNWFTDVQRTPDQEMSYAGREVRQAFTYQFQFNATEQTQAEGLIEANALGNWYVPIWTDMSRAGAVAATDTVINCDTDGAFEASGKVLLFQDRATYVLADIQTIGSGTITLTGQVGQSLTNPAVVPIRDGYTTEGLSSTRAFAGDVNSSLTLHIRTADDTETSPYATYLAEPVVADASYSSLPISARSYQAIDAVDGGLGTVVLEGSRNILDGLYGWSAQQETITDLKAWRRWLNYLRGRDGAFWLSRRSRDFVAQVPIGAADTTITIAPVYATLAEYVGRHISIGGTVFREITGAVANGNNVDIAIAATGQAFTDPEISLLKKFRLDSDTVEIAHAFSRAQSSLVIRETS